MPPVALITGGASGMGLAVAQALGKRGNWHIHLLDLNTDAGAKAESSIGKNAHFHKVDCTNYDSLAQTFDKIFKAEGQLDFVFANAGIVERRSFYDTADEQDPPPAPFTLTLDVNLTSVVWQTYLANHYMKKNPKGVDSIIVQTASCGGLYPSPFSPVYSASKFGVVGLMRSIAKYYFLHDGIRVNCICPGTVRTNLLDAQGWANFPEEYFTPVEKIVESVLMLVDGKDMTDAYGTKVEAGKGYGLAVEVNGKNHYFRKQHDYCDKQMESVMVATDVERQIGGALKS
ncbi:NAD(P)-binding protein [Rhizodiscina lignyota]|uniref:NAD(P)-binding protein n=1 Tax=Rhizodiscina lignyota TaxID=1504668 RepID=A0A9P4M1Q5_9PEZI|nr:NAD(P)-binding protein [Rhizodiscina lignyota]